MQKINSKLHVDITYINLNMCMLRYIPIHIYIHALKCGNTDTYINKHKHLKQIHYTFLTVYKQHHPNSI